MLHCVLLCTRYSRPATATGAVVAASTARTPKAQTAALGAPPSTTPPKPLAASGLTQSPRLHSPFAHPITQKQQEEMAASTASPPPPPLAPPLKCKLHAHERLEINVDEQQAIGYSAVVAYKATPVATAGEVRRTIRHPSFDCTGLIDRTEEHLARSPLLFPPPQPPKTCIGCLLTYAPPITG